MTFDIHLLFVVITCEKVQFMALEKAWKLGEFFLLLCGHPA